MKSGKWKTLSSKIVLQNPWFKVRQDKVITPDGKPGQYNVVITPPSVFVVPVDSQGNIHLIKMYRYPTQMYSIEVPGGRSDGEILLTAAKRELEEELGMTAKSWKKIGKFQAANGVLSELAHVFLATNLKSSYFNEREEEGIVETLKVSYKKALLMIEQGKITDGLTIVALHLAGKHLKK